MDDVASSLCLIMPESTRIGISAANHGARPKQSACAIPNLGLYDERKRGKQQLAYSRIKRNQGKQGENLVKVNP